MTKKTRCTKKTEKSSAALIIGKNKAYELLKTNTIPSFKIGREWKVTKEALDGYIESLNKKD